MHFLVKMLPVTFVNSRQTELSWMHTDIKEKLFKMLNFYAKAFEKILIAKCKQMKMSKWEKTRSLLSFQEYILLSFQNLGLQTTWFPLQLFYNFLAAVFIHPNLTFKCWYQKLSVFLTVMWDFSLLSLHWASSSRNKINVNNYLCIFFFIVHSKNYIIRIT